MKWVDVFVSDEVNALPTPRTFSEFERVVGKTPITKLKALNDTKARIFVKKSFLNPTGSIKDVMAYYMMKRAEEEGDLRPGSEILEMTSGNTGISFSFLSSLKGYSFTAVLPGNMSRERVRKMEANGARVVITPAEEDVPGALRKYEEMARRSPGAWLPSQFSNRDNIEAHRQMTGMPIIRFMGSRKVDAFVAGVGTGGTLMGTAQALREANPGVRIVAVEPAESAVMTGGKPGAHGIQGIGEGFIPELVDTGTIDDIITVRTRDAIGMTRRLREEEGLFVGISSGGNVLASLKIARKLGEGANVVTVLPDSGGRYVSTGIFNGEDKK